jgi:hypothetical protein
MHTVLVFLLGGLAYALSEFAVAASVARWFPNKLHYFRSVGDALVRWCSKPTPDFSCSTESVDDEITEDWPCQCPVCKAEWEKACNLIPEGAAVRFYNSKDGMTYNGVTFKAKVEDGNLVYIVEYGTVDGDISQVEVDPDMIRVKWEELCLIHF